MNDFLKILTRKNSLRKNTQDVSVEELERVISNLQEFIEGKKTEEAALAAELEAKQAKVEAIKQSMLDAGIDINELMSLVESTSSVKKAVKAKYRLTDENGEVHEWSGRGRTPVVFQKRIDAGASKEDFLITD